MSGDFDLSKFDFSKIGDVARKAQQMKDAMGRVQQELLELTVIGKSANKAVSVKMRGNHIVLSVSINDDLFEENPEAIAKGFEEATNDAVAQIEKMAKDKMKKLQEELGLPSGAEGMGGMGGLLS